MLQNIHINQNSIDFISNFHDWEYIFTSTLKHCRISDRMSLKNAWVQFWEIIFHLISTATDLLQMYLLLWRSIFEFVLYFNESMNKIFIKPRKWLISRKYTEIFHNINNSTPWLIFLVFFSVSKYSEISFHVHEYKASVRRWRLDK